MTISAWELDGAGPLGSRVAVLLLVTNGPGLAQGSVFCYYSLNG